MKKYRFTYLEGVLIHFSSKSFVLSLLKIFFLFNFWIVFSGCNFQNEKEDDPTPASVSEVMKKVDSVYMSGNLTRVNHILDSLKPHFAPSDIENLTEYYIYKTNISLSDKKSNPNLYTDSLLSIFQQSHMQEKYKAQFIKALMLKGDILILNKQYDAALEFYFKTKSLADKEKDPFNYSDFIAKMAQIYYTQGKFALSARYQKEAYETVLNAKNLTPSTRFYIIQGCLNNAGFSYEQAHMLDSALYFYLKNINYIEKEGKAGPIGEKQYNNSKIVALDNLGGLYLKKEDYPLALKYLEQCIAINNYSLSPVKITAFLKLAKTYTRTGNITKADSILNLAYRVINKDSVNLYANKVKFYQAKSDILLVQKKYKEAIENLQNYKLASDTLNRINNAVHKVDVAQKFQFLQNQEYLKYLEKTNESKSLYLVGALMFVCMLIPIIVLSLTNARQAKRAQNAATEHSKALEETMKNLEQRNKDYAKMMKVMAHDLKNPIGGIVGVARLLLEEDHFSEEDKEMLSLIASSGENSIEMMNQLLNSGLAIENEVTIKEDTDLNQLLHQCCELLQYKADEKQQKIMFTSSGPVSILAGKEKIWRVFNNLIVNAIKFSPRQTVINVVLEQLNKSVRIAVIDQGIGVPEKNKQKIFEMFTDAKRLGTAGEQPFGIGLSISKQIIESHGGKIWLEDNPKGGTIFYVEFPLV
ncbi:ATP-binding protein [Pedobacter sp.]|uniref:tetratricopeptide repeat-containing sensor histidine kinase n=1 Tax=Pedobacter sp. TaxID=1411316 RepID=UPI00396CA9EF